MYDVTHDELLAEVEAEEREWLSADDIHPYKSRVCKTKGNTVSFPKITKFNTYILSHYAREIVEEINGLLYDGELAAICGVDGFYSQQLPHEHCRIDPRMTFWRVNKYEFTADLVVYLKARVYDADEDDAFHAHGEYDADGVFHVHMLCDALGVSESGYYRYLRRKSRPSRDALLSAEIQKILDEHP